MVTVIIIIVGVVVGGVAIAVVVIIVVIVVAVALRRGWSRGVHDSKPLDETQYHLTNVCVGFCFGAAIWYFVFLFMRVSVSHFLSARQGTRLGISETTACKMSDNGD